MAPAATALVPRHSPQRRPALVELSLCVCFLSCSVHPCLGRRPISSLRPQQAPRAQPSPWEGDRPGRGSHSRGDTLGQHPKHHGAAMWRRLSLSSRNNNRRHHKRDNNLRSAAYFITLSQRTSPFHFFHFLREGDASPRATPADQSQPAKARGSSSTLLGARPSARDARQWQTYTFGTVLVTHQIVGPVAGRPPEGAA